MAETKGCGFVASFDAKIVSWTMQLKGFALNDHYSESSSSAVFTMTKEIVASTILLPLIDTLSDPDFWKQQIDEKDSILLACG